MLISKLEDLENVDVAGLDEVTINLTTEVANNFKTILSRLFPKYNVVGTDNIYRSMYGNTWYHMGYSFNSIYVSFLSDCIKIQNHKPIEIANTNIDKRIIPIKTITQKLDKIIERNKNDKNLKNVYEFEYSLMKPLIESELSEHGIELTSSEQNIEVKIKYSPVVKKSELKRDLRIKHEIGDNFPVSLSFHGDNGYVTFRSISWSKARTIILALNS